jgi:pilus assembly protein CpaC
MRIVPLYRIDGKCRTGRSHPFLATSLICLALAGRLSAQVGEGAAAQEPLPAPPKTEAGPEPLPVRSPRPPAEVSAAVGKLTTNDATFEVILGQSRILPLKIDLSKPELKDRVSVAVGDPSVADFNVINTQQLRIVGQRIGVTDLSIIAGDQVYSFEVRVVADLDPLRLQLRAAFPDAQVKLTPTRDHVVVEGQARDTPQVARIIDAVRAYLDAIYATELRKIRATQPAGVLRPGTAAPPQPINPSPPRPGPGGPGGGRMPAPQPGTPAPGDSEAAQPVVPGVGVPEGALPPGIPVSPELGLPAAIEATAIRPQIINLLKVPGCQQVLLKVRVAELNRTALRQIGADFLGVNPSTGAIIGTQIGGATVTASGTVVNRTLHGTASTAASPQTTVFGIFERGDVEVMLSALRRNSIVKILAEPNLVAMNGHKASFLAGGKFPVPVPQATTGGIGATVTVQFEPFGVELDFLPFILDDDRIRLSVHPQVSTIDFAIGTTLVPGGSVVPGLDSREARTTVELRQGQTLAIAGLLYLTLDGQTSRIPGLGDLPILGPFFSNTTETRTEKELVVLVTPYLVDAMNPDQVPPTPGDEVKEPNDLEFYLLNRIEGRTGRDFRSTVQYDDATHVLRCLFRLEKDHVRGPYGFCD